MGTRNTKVDPPEAIGDYIARFPAVVQDILQTIRRPIHQAAPEAVEAIKYQIPTFVLYGNLVHFGAYPKYSGFYPTPSGIEARTSWLPTAAPGVRSNSRWIESSRST